MDANDIFARVESLYRSDSPRVLATLIRRLGDFDLAEDAMHDAFQAALEQWPAQGIPAEPVAWLISAGRNKGIDRQRRARFESPLDTFPEPPEPIAAEPTIPEPQGVEDDRLRLIFTCCHPDLPPDARAALTLREVCGLTTEEIARAFLTTPPAMAQRIVRAKARIREARIPYEVPAASELPERLGTVLQVVYLVFNEGYSASSGESLTRSDLSSEAIRLGRLLLEFLPEPEVMGLVALMLLHESRRLARASPNGDVILLDQQDRSLWNHDLIEEGTALAQHALASNRVGAYTLQAAISSVHAGAARAEDTDWSRITALYDLLWRIEPSPVVELNRAVAVAMRDGPAAGLALVEDLFARGELDTYGPAHSARADLYRRLGRVEDALASYEKALALARQEPERRFLLRRLRELD